MRKWFNRSLWLSGGYLVSYLLGLFISIFLGVSFQESVIADMASGLAAAILCTTPHVLLFMLITGIGTLRENRNEPEKRKRDMASEFYTSDEERLQRILNRLSADDREFLEAQLAGRNLGLHDDGEIVSLTDLLDDQESRYR
jgi:hypothetical protein